MLQILRTVLMRVLGVTGKDAGKIMKALDKVGKKEMQRLTRHLEARAWKEAGKALPALLKKMASVDFAKALGATAFTLAKRLAGIVISGELIKLVPKIIAELRKLLPPTKPPGKPGPAKKVVNWKELKYGQRNSASVKLLQQELNDRVGAKLPITGNYLTKTKAAVAKFQRAQGWTGKGADGLIYPGGKQTTRRLFPAARYTIRW